MLELRVQCSRREREGALLHEKAGYLARVNADLHRRLEEYEREGLRTQTELEQKVRALRVGRQVLWGVQESGVTGRREGAAVWRWGW